MTIGLEFMLLKADMGEWGKSGRGAHLKARAVTALSLTQQQIPHVLEERN
jgi:hypothetical protein